jgi:hypothetical protein
MVNTHIQVLIRLMVYLFTRIQAGQKLTFQEKNDILVGLSKLAVDFFSTYITNDELGKERMEVSPHNNLCLSRTPYVEDEDEVPEVFQDVKVRPAVPNVPRRLRKKRQVAVPQTDEESGVSI